MPVKLEKETVDQLIISIKQYFEESLDQSIGDLKASLMIDYILKEFGPVIYNRAVADAQARMQDMVSELDGTCFEPEFTFWKR